MSRANSFLGFIVLSVGLGVLLLTIHPRFVASHYLNIQVQRLQLVRELRLTDLCLFTEARYTRHPTQADLHSAFQEHPLALEHYPSGAMLCPPPRFLNGYRNLERRTFNSRISQHRTSDP